MLQAHSTQNNMQNLFQQISNDSAEFHVIANDIRIESNILFQKRTIKIENFTCTLYLLI